MQKTLVIPDVHLKPWMFKSAEELIEIHEPKHIVIIGDIADDWNQEENTSLYINTFDTMLEFCENHPNTKWCYGNHDISYVWGAWESGYSQFAKETVQKYIDKIKDTLPKENIAFVHKIGQTLFSHAGLTNTFVERMFTPETDIDTMVKKINSFREGQLWIEDSPIWARPQGDIDDVWDGYWQVVGHTPVVRPVRTGRLLTVDTFSTYRDGGHIGDERFVLVDADNGDAWAIDAGSMLRI